MAQMRKSAPPKKTLTPQTARKIVKGEMVRQSTLDQIRKDGMALAIKKVKSGKATPEYRTGATRMYGIKRVPPAVKKVAKKKTSTYDPTVWKFFTDPLMGGMNKAMTTTGNVVKKAGSAYVQYTKAVTNPKNIKKAITSKGKKSPRLKLKKGMK
jgi:hypothetical protein